MDTIPGDSQTDMLSTAFRSQQFIILLCVIGDYVNNQWWVHRFFWHICCCCHIGLNSCNFTTVNDSQEIVAANGNDDSLAKSLRSRRQCFAKVKRLALKMFEMI